MSTLTELHRFIDTMKKVTSEQELSDVLQDFTQWLGFDWFAMGHHVDLARPPRQAIRVTNYDPRWIEHVVEQRYFADDPIHAASMRAVTGFRWDALPLPQLTPRQQYILAQARQYGLVAGYSVPIFLPGEYGGTCSFAGRSFDKLRPYALELSDVVAAAAFECARRLMQAREGGLMAPVPVLKPREREALILVGRGKTDEGIAEVMGITKKTAHGYIENVRLAYGHLSRPSLVLRAVFDNQFSFADAFWR